MLLTLYSLPEILFLKSHGLKGLYSWGVSWGVAYVPTMQLKKLATMAFQSNSSEWSAFLLTSGFLVYQPILTLSLGRVKAGGGLRTLRSAILLVF